MNIGFLRVSWKRLAVIAGIAVVSGCATAPPPPPPPPSPRVAEATPYRPIPPGGAAYQMDIPPRGVDGIRHTVNSGLNDNETLWHFRSGWNVAALNCSGPEYAPIIEGYRAFLNNYARQLNSANTAIDQRFRSEASSNRGAIQAREAFMTQVYNFFTLPAARGEFCAAALASANEILTAPPADLPLFAATGLQSFELAFEHFFQEYEQYQQASGEWDRRFGRLYGASQPGYVAVYGLGAQTVPAGMTPATSQPPASLILDPETGAMIPVVPVAEGVVSTPVLQPLPSGQ